LLGIEGLVGVVGGGGGGGAVVDIYLNALKMILSVCCGMDSFVTMDVHLHITGTESWRLFVSVSLVWDNTHWMEVINTLLKKK